MNQHSYPAGNSSPTVSDATMMRRRSTDKDPSGTVRVLRSVSAIGLLLPMFLFAIVAWKDRSDILAGAESDGTKIVSLFREQAGNLFAGHEMILDMVADRMRDRDWSTTQSTDLLREFEVMDRRLDDASEILLVDATGVVRATPVHVQPNQPPPAPDQKCFLALSTSQIESCISQPHTDPRSGHDLFSLSRRLEKRGVFSGIAQVAISADYIVDLWAAATPSASDIVTLFRSDGTVLAQSDGRSQAGSSVRDVGQSLISKIGQSESGVIRAPSSTDGVDRITIYSKVAGNPVYISLSLAKNVILKKWYANLTVYGLVAAITAVGVMMALGIALRRAHAFNNFLTAIRRQ
jgi:hypothetical protein